jgi:hypothetical protein
VGAPLDALLHLVATHVLFNSPFIRAKLHSS